MEGTSQMEPAKLKDLRARFSDREVFKDGDDPVLTEAGRQVQSPDGKRTKPYSGIPTLLGLPSAPDLTNLDIAVIGVPMDLGVTNRPGARFGPRAVRTIERVGPYNHQLRVAPSTIAQMADIGDVPFRSRFSLEKSIEDIATFYHQVCDAGLRALSVGGDHSITYPILTALGRDVPVGLVHIDAHCDTSGEYDFSKFHHGGPFRLAVLDGVVDPTRTIQIGIRGSAELLWEFSYDAGMTVLHIEDFMR